jgi:hypothetical protein
MGMGKNAGNPGGHGIRGDHGGRAMGGLNQNQSLWDLNAKRKIEYYKDPDQEKRIFEMNRVLFESEFRGYKNEGVMYPFLFVFGVPRSGTTVSAQILANCLDVGYINNLVARFYLAPLHGLAISDSLHIQKQISYKSEYASTEGIADLHEFGYFWRYWLKKETVHDFTHATEKEGDIDWAGLHRTLCSIQQAFSKPVVFKNMFGAYHIKKLCAQLEKVVFIYIERDDLDTAISILDARKKFYKDLNIWWSNIPPEFDRLKDLDYWRQIAGQIHYLKAFYSRQIQSVDEKHVIQLNYEDICTRPREQLVKIQTHILRYFGYEIKIVDQPPAIVCRTYVKRKAERDRFGKILRELADKR